MSREIKFRIWDSDYKRFLSNIDVVSLAALNGRIGGFIAQQFIGKLDINQKEIYEGDIIEVRHFDGWDDVIGYKMNAEVFYFEPECAFKYRITKDHVAGHGFPNVKGMIYKVVGNIFENPELINESKW
jgi:uncharacterized phage protein (TIGR01671 family)